MPSHGKEYSHNCLSSTSPFHISVATPEDDFVRFPPRSPGIEFRLSPNATKYIFANNEPCFAADPGRSQDIWGSEQLFPNTGLLTVRPKIHSSANTSHNTDSRMHVTILTAINYPTGKGGQILLNPLTVRGGHLLWYRPRFRWQKSIHDPDGIPLRSKGEGHIYGRKGDRVP